ncbi:MAG: BrnA antitoxin family protein [Bryobacterales bacterium]|nr:BrnA antitoxin family protein [Bryobacterales bacterium]
MSSLRKPTLAGGKRVTIRLDNDVLAWFRAQVDQAGDGNYQSQINIALRAFMEEAREPLESVLRRVIREELELAR